ncbi:MAG: type I methionyl aminopeptidase [Candidatus Omnitrophica bacterium]|nr:type I methionyl aminopeptidase [Candidatus Omnitrophota bacterium]
MIILKSPDEIALMRQAGQIVAKLLDFLKDRVQSGVKTKTLDQQAEEFIRQQGAQPAFLGYRGFPATICISINEEIVHGIPGERRIQAGDLVSLDVGAIWHGYYADAAITIPVEPVSPAARYLTEITQKSMEEGIAKAIVGNRLTDISHRVQQVIEAAGFGVVRDFVGHGIGKDLHEAPAIPNFGLAGMGPRLKEGMVLAIEPMVTMGSYEVEILSDGWTAVTKDRSLSAHFEHTVAITPNGVTILTQH